MSPLTRLFRQAPSRAQSPSRSGDSHSRRPPATIHAGNATPSSLNAPNGQRADVQRTSTKPFSGFGNQLGAPLPGSSASHPAPTPTVSSRRSRSRVGRGGFPLSFPFLLSIAGSLRPPHALVLARLTVPLRIHSRTRNSRNALCF
ncbi:hypothetical protein K438DRAFT_1855125 [Mycena galopus ATCC 62051]|nr:hypothetical protein K438DRAFT_1855125 [Mycena galopus ATCC 62051]